MFRKKKKKKKKEERKKKLVRCSDKINILLDRKKKFIT
jgi:hypothetical protein